MDQWSSPLSQATEAFSLKKKSAGECLPCEWENLDFPTHVAVIQVSQ